MYKIIMNLTVTLYAAILFFILSPNVLLRIPSKGSKFVVAAVHALVFALIFHFTHKFVWKLSVGLEGNGPMSNGSANPESKKTTTPTPTPMPTPVK